MFRLLKLKPPHGWNAVAWELAIVTVGVLIALAAQQWANDWNARRSARAAEKALRTELGDHYASSVEWRMVHPCLLAQIEQLEQRVMESGERLQPARLYSEAAFNSFVIRMPSKEYTSSAWRAAIADGVTSNLDPALREELSQHYEQAQSVVELTDRNIEAVNALLSLSRPMPLDPSVRYSIITALDELRGRADYMDLTAGQLIDHIVRAKMVPDPAVTLEAVQLSGTRIFCAAHHLPVRSLKEAEIPVPYKYSPVRPGAPPRS